MVADKRTNALLIRDTDGAGAAEKRVAEMDIPLAQVQLASYIVTINSENLHELGVRWGVGSG